ncbi:MAG: YopX family protein [Roseburia sp.]|nr:YopX family protein [Roseburia sp.]
MDRLKLKECQNCEEWKGDITDCFEICMKPIEALEKFNEYMDLEEQGKLLRLSYKVGDIVYVILMTDSHITKAQINKIEVKPTVYGKMCYLIEPVGNRGHLYTYHESDFGKTLFLTQEQAELTLQKKREGEQKTRELLFRAKRKDTGEWVEGLPSYGRDGTIKEIEYMKETPGEEIPKVEFVEVDSGTICQYTGVKDKNGKEIYEGDICKRVLLPTKRIESLFRISYDPVKCCLSAMDLDGGNVTFINDYINKDYEFEVIGNSYENPELLGGD